MPLDFPALIAIFFAVSFAVAQILKRFAKADTYLIVSLIRTKKPLGFFDRMARHRKLLDAFALLGLVLGFGSITVDYYFGRKLPAARRAMLFILSFASLSAFLMLIDQLLGNPFSKNILVGPSYPLLVASFGLMGFAGFALFSLLLQAVDIVGKYLLGIRGCPGIAPLIPGVEIPRVPITPPLHAWISLLIILLVHEGMHGILGRRHGFEIKSTGVILLGFLPIGAFVEPDEAAVRSAKEEKVLPFLAAGPMANLTLMLLAGLLLFAGVSGSNALTEKLYPGLQAQIFSGAKIAKVTESTMLCGASYPSPAYGVFSQGDIVKKINGAAIASPQALLLELQKGKGSPKIFELDRNGTAVMATLSPNAMGQFGFVVEPIRNENIVLPDSYRNYSLVTYFLLDFIYWLLLLNFLVAIINFLPMNPFDGGRIAMLMFAPYFGFLGKSKEETQKFIAKLFIMAIVTLLVVNALPLFF